MQKKRILFLINKLKRGGAEIVFSRQINWLVEREFDVYLGILFNDNTFDKYFLNLKIDKERIITLGFESLFDIKKYFNLHQFIKKEKISIIYSTLEYSNIVARLTGLFNSELSVFIRESNTADKKKKIFKLIDILLNWAVQKIIAVSEGVKLSLLKYQGIYQDKVIVLPNGVDIPSINDNNKPEKKEINILNVGGLREQKNQMGLLEAFSEILKEKDNLNLTILGEGPLKETLEKYIREKGLENRVKLIGELLDPARIAEFYKTADIFVLSSLWEGCSNALLEAMAFGVPPISTKVGGSTEIIEDGLSGYLVEIKNKVQMKEKLCALIRDEGLRKLMGRNAQKRIEDKYTIDKMVESLIKIFNT